MTDPIPLIHAPSGFEQCRQHAALIAFNSRPSQYLHHSWRTEFADAGLSDFLFDGAYAHGLLSEYILLKTGMADIPYQDWRHPAMQIGMHLNAVQMQELACRLALILIGQPIRHAISNPAVAAWTAALGEPLYRFTCKHAPLLGGARFVNLPEWQEWQSPSISPKTVVAQTRNLGFRFLNRCSHVVDAAIGQRVRLKLPREIAQRTSLKINPDHYQEVWTWINKVWSSMPMPASPSIIPGQAAYK